MTRLPVIASSVNFTRIQAQSRNTIPTATATATGSRITPAASRCQTDHQLTRLMRGMVVYPENMGKNLSLSLRIWNSQTLLLALIRKGQVKDRFKNLGLS